MSARKMTERTVMGHVIHKSVCPEEGQPLFSIETAGDKPVINFVNGHENSRKFFRGSTKRFSDVIPKPIHGFLHACVLATKDERVLVQDCCYVQTSGKDRCGDTTVVEKIRIREAVLYLQTHSLARNGVLHGLEDASSGLVIVLVRMVTLCNTGEHRSVRTRGFHKGRWTNPIPFAIPAFAHVVLYVGGKGPFRGVGRVVMEAHTQVHASKTVVGDVIVFQAAVCGVLCKYNCGTYNEKVYTRW